MAERKILVSVLLIAIIVSLSGYGIVWFSTPEERVTTTTTTKTSTSTIVKDNSSTLSPPANSTAVVKSRFVLNGSVFLMLTIDKSVYSQGESMNIKSTVSNLGPDNVQLDIDVNIISVYNSTGNLVWTFSESFFERGFGPLLEGLWINLGPYCSAGIVSLWEYRQLNNPDRPEGSCKYSIDESIVKWNMTGLHTVTDQISGITRIRTLYDDYYLPEGEYTLFWEPTLQMNGQKETFRETISFTITK